MSAIPEHRGQVDGYSIEPLEPSGGPETRPGRNLTLLSEVDLTQVEVLRSKSSAGRKLSYTAFVVKAIGLALRELPYANRRYYHKGFWPFGGPKIQAFDRRGVAVEQDVVGADGRTQLEIIRDADHEMLETIDSAIQTSGQALVGSDPRSRPVDHMADQHPSNPEQWIKYRGGAVLIGSMDKLGVDAILGACSYPIGVSFGQVKHRPIVAGHAVVARPTFFLSMNYDRRVMSETQAARFTRRVVANLETAEVVMGPFVMPEAPPTRVDFPTVDEYQTRF